MDAERVCVDYLNAAGTGATAYYDVPSNRPGAFIVVERTGGPRGEGGTSRPVIDVQCWAADRRGAAELAGRVEEALGRMPAEVDDIARASVTSTFRDRDLESGSPRYHVVCELFSNI